MQGLQRAQPHGRLMETNHQGSEHTFGTISGQLLVPLPAILLHCMRGWIWFKLALHAAMFKPQLAHLKCSFEFVPFCLGGLPCLPESD